MKRWEDKKLESIKQLTEDVVSEQNYQISEWGVQTRSSFEWMCSLTEEVGELAQAILEYEYRDPHGHHDVYDEAIQVATLALKIAEMSNQ